jgi:hypothetical protein
MLVDLERPGHRPPDRPAVAARRPDGVTAWQRLAKRPRYVGTAAMRRQVVEPRVPARRGPDIHGGRCPAGRDQITLTPYAPSPTSRGCSRQGPSIGPFRSAAPTATIT